MKNPRNVTSRLTDRHILASVLIILTLFLFVGSGCTFLFPEQEAEDLDPSELDNRLPSDWDIRYEKPESTSISGIDGQWYYFNLYTIDAISPAGIDYLKVTFSGSYQLMLVPTSSAYEGSHSFTAWVFIPDSYVLSRSTVFSVERSDGVSIRDMEMLNLRISPYLQDNGYYSGAVPYSGDSDYGEFRKVIRTWTDTELPEQTMSIQVAYDVPVNTGALSFEGEYACTPDILSSSRSTSGGDPDYVISSTGSDGDYTVTLKHLPYLSSSVEQAIGNTAAINLVVSRDMYNMLTFEKNLRVPSEIMNPLKTFSSQTMAILKFLTMKFELSSDKSFGDGDVNSVTLSSMYPWDVSSAYEPYLPFNDSLMSDIHSFDPDNDDDSELDFTGDGSSYWIGFRGTETYSDSSGSITFESITSYDGAASSMSPRNENSGITFTEEDGVTVIGVTSGGSYYRAELTRVRPMSAAEFSQLDSQTHLNNPIDDIFGD